MKILVIGHPYMPAINRGKWIQFLKFFPDTTLELVVPRSWPDALFSLEAENDSTLKVHQLPVLWAGLEGRYVFRSGLKKIIQDFRPDIIHVEQGSDALVYAQAILLAKLAGVKAKFGFFTWMNIDIHRSRKVKWIEKFNLKKSHYAVCGNKAAEKLIRERGFNGPILKSAELGVDPTLFRKVNKPDLRKKLNIKEKLTVGFIGRLVPEKGILDLVQVWSELKKENIDSQLLLIGKGPLREQIQSQIQSSQLADDFSILGPFNHKDLIPYMQALDILVLPSKTTSTWIEQFGHVLIEAMACEIPVVGSNSGAIPEVIGDAGLIFEEGNVAELKAKLKPLIQFFYEREKWGLMGCQRMVNNFSDEALAKKLYQFFHSSL